MNRTFIFIPLILLMGWQPALGSAPVAEINACQYLVIRDFSSDPYGIAKELREQAATRGFVVTSSNSDIPGNDLLKSCVLSGSWSANGFGGQLAIRVVDAHGSLVAEAATRATAWVNASRTVRAAVSKIYSQLKYKGFDENLYRQRIQREYPKRPMLAISEEEIKRAERQNQVEGIWTDADDRYRIGIVPATKNSGADYVAVVLRSSSPLWEPGEIKAEIRSTASMDVYTCTYFMQNKKPAGMTLTFDHKTVLRGSTVSTETGPWNLQLVRVWPKAIDEASSESTVKSVSSGTGFVLSRTGLIATNWHVVADAKHISATFPNWSASVNAEVVVKDKVNDLAILRLTERTGLDVNCSDLPFQVTSTNNVTLGERVSTVGYPLTAILGSNPKFSEGAVSSKSGLQDDPRWLQISAPVQPGSSGSPLFDTEGNIIGIVVASLDAGTVFQTVNAIPQNVNFAIKADYLLSLFGMMASDSMAARTTAFSPDKAAKCIANIRAWQ